MVSLVASFVPLAVLMTAAVIVPLAMSGGSTTSFAVGVVLLLISFVAMAIPVATVSSTLQQVAKEDEDPDERSGISELAELQRLVYELRNHGMVNDASTASNVRPNPLVELQTADSSTASNSRDRVRAFNNSGSTTQSFAGAIPNSSLPLISGEPFELQSKTIIVAIITATNGEINPNGCSAASKAFADAVSTAASSVNASIESLFPFQAVVSIGARGPTVDGAMRALRLAIAVVGPLNADSRTGLCCTVIIDRGSYLTGESYYEGSRHRVLVSPHLDALYTLAPLVHQELKVPVVVTERMSQAFTEVVERVPVDIVEWPTAGGDGKLRMILFAAMPRVSSMTSGPETVAVTRDAFARLREGRAQEAIDLLEAARTTFESAVQPNARAAEIANVLLHVLAQLLRVAKQVQTRSGRLVRKYVAWSSGNFTAPNPPLLQVGWAQLNVGSQLSEISQFKQEQQASFDGSATGMSEDVGLFEMAFTLSAAGETSRTVSIGLTKLAASHSGGISSATTDNYGPNSSALSVASTTSTLSKRSQRPTDLVARVWRTSGVPMAKGAFGEIFRAQNTTGGLAAVKRLPMISNKIDTAALQSELSVSASVSHENLVSLLASEVRREELILVMELVPGGSVQGLLDDFGEFPPRIVRSAATDILRGLSYLHSAGIVHCDLKPQNVLVDTDGMYKVADYGSALHSSQEPSQREDLNMVKGSPAYVAPEVARGDVPTAASDIWSFGIMLHEMATGMLPYNAAQCGNIRGGPAFVRMVGQLSDRCSDPDSLKAPPNLNIEMNGELAELGAMIRACLTLQPATRPTAEELLAMPFLL